MSQARCSVPGEVEIFRQLPGNQTIASIQPVFRGIWPR